MSSTNTNSNDSSKFYVGTRQNADGSTDFSNALEWLDAPPDFSNNIKLRDQRMAKELEESRERMESFFRGSEPGTMEAMMVLMRGDESYDLKNHILEEAVKRLAEKKDISRYPSTKTKGYISMPNPPLVDIMEFVDQLENEWTEKDTFVFWAVSKGKAITTDRSQVKKVFKDFKSSMKSEIMKRHS